MSLIKKTKSHDQELQKKVQELRKEVQELRKEVDSHQRTIIHLKYENERLRNLELVSQGVLGSSDPNWPFEDDYRTYERVKIRHVEYFILPEKEWYHVETDADMSVSIILLNTEGELFGVYNKTTGEMTDVDWEDENKD